MAVKELKTDAEHDPDFRAHLDCLDKLIPHKNEKCKHGPGHGDDRFTTFVAIEHPARWFCPAWPRISTMFRTGMRRGQSFYRLIAEERVARSRQE